MRIDSSKARPMNSIPAANPSVVKPAGTEMAGNPEKGHEEVMLNVMSVVDIKLLFLLGLLKKGNGAVITFLPQRVSNRILTLPYMGLLRLSYCRLHRSFGKKTEHAAYNSSRYVSVQRKPTFSMSSAQMNLLLENGILENVYESVTAGIGAWTIICCSLLSKLI